MDINLRILSITVVLFLSACANQSSQKNAVDYVGGDVQETRAKLSEAAVSTAGSLNQLSALEKASAPKSKMGQPLNGNAVGLGGLASVDWTGPIGPLVNRLAREGHYQFRAVGQHPPTPVIITIHAVNMPIADILRDANVQAGHKADVIVYPARRLIELKYH